jgi:hypothetical protein
VARLRVEPGCRAQGRTVAELEAAAGSRVLLLDNRQGPSWRPDGGTPLGGGAKLVAVVPRGASWGRALAWTETGVHAGRQGFGGLEKGAVHERNRPVQRAAGRAALDSYEGLVARRPRRR